MGFKEKVEEWLNNSTCAHCDETPSKEASYHEGMRPQYVDPYLENLVGPNEQHEVDPDAHCINPKCNYQFTPQDEITIRQNRGLFTCPNCGFEHNYLRTPETYDEGEWAWGDPAKEQIYRTRPANPGGITKSGLTLDQMGDIGEQVVSRAGELPGVGAITWTSTEKTFPIDAEIDGQRGKFGVEIKANHSQAQERFKVGGQSERAAKIQYCMVNGLKPALVGVRLNFYTDRADIFFREGLTDTWVGNPKMQHVMTVNFRDLNPFQSPDPQAQALAVDNAQLPDQSEEEEFNRIFGKTADFSEDDHPRDDEGKFVVKEDVHVLKVVDKKGKHTHNIIRCKHCGFLLQIPEGHHGRVECPTCGEDPQRKLKLAKIVISNSRAADEVASKAGWDFKGRNANGHRVYTYTSPDGLEHNNVVGSGRDDRGAMLDAQKLRGRINRCMEGQCTHTHSSVPSIESAPGAPVLRAGQTVNNQIILEITGELALVQDLASGKEDVVPLQQLRVAAENPSFLFVYYGSELIVEPWDVNVSYERMLHDLLDEFGVDLGNTVLDIDTTKVDAGEIWTSGFGEPDIRHLQLNEPTIRAQAEIAIKDWWRKQNSTPWDDIEDWRETLI